MTEANLEFKICKFCIMDETDKNIQFDENGICNYCQSINTKIKNYQISCEESEINLKNLAQRIKERKNINSKYDSILGLSGGVDSSYVAYLANKMNLQPLCVHFDNGWDSDIAVKNIKNIINITGFDLYSYVIDWPEFRDLQRSFFKAGVVDIEMLTDHAIFASLFKIAKDHKIKTVLSGTNFTTENGMPKDWSWAKMDLKNIKSIQKKFGSLKIKSFPTMSPIYWSFMMQFSVGGVFEEVLNQINYRKHDAMNTLEAFFLWQYYGGKHYESVFTKFYQAYVLPTKFGIDKRKVHYSSLIRNNEITREIALIELTKPLYEKTELELDKKFVLKKLGFSNEEFDQIMKEKPIPHDFYSSSENYLNPIKKILKLFIKSKY